MQDFSKSESSIQATEYLLSHSSEQKKDYFTLHKQESPTSLTFHEDRCSIIANCWRNKSMRIIVCALLGQFGIVFGIVLFFIGFFSLGPLEALRERQLVRGECLLIEKLWKEDFKDVGKQKRYFPFFIVDVYSSTMEENRTNLERYKNDRSKTSVGHPDRARSQSKYAMSIMVDEQETLSSKNKMQSQGEASSASISIASAKMKSKQSLRNTEGILLGKALQSCGYSKCISCPHENDNLCVTQMKLFDRFQVGFQYPCWFSDIHSNNPNVVLILASDSPTFLSGVILSSLSGFLILSAIFCSIVVYLTNSQRIRHKSFQEI